MTKPPQIPDEESLEEILVQPPAADPLLELRGTGSELWSDEHADEYVARLRSS